MPVTPFVDAKYPEDVFGEIAETGDLARREIARRHRRILRDQRLHPDQGGDADEFKRFQSLYRAALEAVAAGTYGQRGTLVDAVLIRTRRNAYRVSRLVARGAVANIYAATYEADGETRDAQLSIVRDPRDGAKLAHEAKVLKALLTADTEVYDILQGYLPQFIEAFGYRRGRTTRQGIAFREVPGLFSLRDVRDGYPNGVDPRDSAWMLRRLFIALGLVHAVGYAHTLLDLDHILIHPEHHGIVLIDWTAARLHEGETSDDVADAIDAVAQITRMDHAPTRYRRFIDGCRLHPHALPDALTLKDEYDQLIEDLWGPRRFRPFTMTNPEGRVSHGR